MEDERRRSALRYLNTTGVAQGLLGLILFFLGLAARITHGPHVDGIPPYYTGAFIGMSVVSIQAVLGLAIFIRGKDCVNKLEAAEKIGCIMQAYSLMAIFSEIAYTVASLIVGFSGICVTSKCSYTETGGNRRISIAILVFMFFGVISCAIGLGIVCKYSSSFGLKMLSRGQYQISNLVDNTDAVIAYIAAEQTAVTDAAENQQPSSHHHRQQHHQYQHHHYEDPRLAFSTPDYSTHHLQHFLTQQYRDRIRKRRKRGRKRKKENQRVEDETRRRRNGREAPYILPPLAAPSGSYDYQPSSPPRTPPPPPPSPPPLPVHYPPPSPSPETKSPPHSRRTPPLTPSSLPLPVILPRSESPPPSRVNTPSPSPTPTPPLNYPGVIHVIPCGETLDDDNPPLSP